MNEQDARELADAITAKIAARVDAHRRRAEQQRADRAAKNRRRTAGLKARHARKLNRTEGNHQP